jgi:FlaA1/EpsC-like NDP-sugar epimerase
VKSDADGNKIILYGAGGHAASGIGVLEAQGAWQLAGLVDDGPAGNRKSLLGYDVIGDRHCLPEPREAGISRALAAISDNAQRAPAPPGHSRRPASHWSMSFILRPSS